MTKQYKRQLLETAFTQDELNRLYNTKSYYVGSNSGVIDLGDGRYRYLTERECWRLQGYSDKDFDNAAMAHPRKGDFLNGTLYHQAGNSIPVTILESMFMEMI